MLNIYKASAGSGKTYTLAYEYIKMLLGRRVSGASPHYVLNRSGEGRRRSSLYAPHEHILAITFTNKATAEMKSRILKDLEALTVIPEPPMKDAEFAARLMQEYGCTREELATEATNALRRLLDDYGRFNVSTIDAFFQTILRSFAREIDRQGDYRVEIDNTSAISEAMGMLLSEINHPSSHKGISERADDAEIADIRSWLSGRSESRVRESSDYNPFDSTRDMYKGLIAYLENVFTEAFISRRTDMEAYLSAPGQLDDFIGQMKETVVPEIKRRYYALASQTLDRLDPADVKGDIIRYLEKFTPDGGRIKTASTPAFIRHVRDYNPAGLVKAKASHLADHYFDILEAFVNSLDTLDGLDIMTAEIIRQAAAAKSLTYINKYIERYRQDNNLILLSDTNTLLDSIISEEEAPFIFERVGVQLQNFMIDEFQDTSGLQWKHLRPLLRNSLATDNENHIIGDVKQSIYRWRGGDSDLLDHQVQEEFAGRHKVIGSNPGENTNYRSAHTVVRFNNTLFELLGNHSGFIPEAPHGVPGYEGIAQELAANTANYTGFIQYTCADIPQERKDAILKEPGFKVSACLDAERIARNILSQLERGYGQRQIAILVRAGSEAVAIADYFRKFYPQINLISDEALKLTANNTVRKIISALELISQGTPSLDPAVHPEVDETDPDAAKRKNARKRRMKRMMLDCFNYNVAAGMKVSEALSKALVQVRASFPSGADSTAEAVMTETPDHDLREIQRLAPGNLIALVEAVIALKIPDMNERRANARYILALLDTVAEFSRDNIPTLNSFLRFWRAKGGKLTVVPDEHVDAVTITTIHKAKGLQWDCVHVPIDKFSSFSSVSQEWFDTTGLGEFFVRHLGVNPGTPPPILYLNPSDGFGLPGSPFRDQYELQKARSVSDTLNMVYVAFTRAIRELNIYAAPAAASGEGAVAAVLRRVFTTDASASLAASSHIYIDLGETSVKESPDENTEPAVFTIGQPTTPGTSRPKELSRPDPLAVTERRELPEIIIDLDNSEQEVTRLADVDHPDETDSDPATGAELPGAIAEPEQSEGMSPETVAAIRRGTELHSILSRMVSLSDLDDSLAFHRKNIDKQTLDEHEATLRRIFDSAPEGVLEWFDSDGKRILTEQPLYDPATRMHRRIDRLIMHSDGHIQLIDYKFSRKPYPEHVAQIRAYADILRRMGYDSIESILWYPLSSTVKRVSAD